MRFSFFLKAFIFFFFSIIDLSFTSARLNSISINERKKIHLVDLPNGCRVGKDFCVIQLKKGRNFKWSLKNFFISFDEGGVALYKKENHVQLIKGNFLIETKQRLKILTHFGEFYLNRGLALLEVQEKQITATNLTAENFSIRHLGEDQFIILPKAYQMWISGFKNHKKKLSPIFGIPRPAHLNRLLSRWSRLIQEPDSRFFKQLRIFRKSWKLALEETSLWHKKIAQTKTLSSFSPRLSHVRSISLNSSKKKVTPSRKRKKNCHLMRLFFKKNYLNLFHSHLPQGCKN